MNGTRLKDLKVRVGIDQVLEAYGLLERLKRHGDQLVGPCPLHGGDNPTSFRVHLGRGIWHCWTACGGGDTVDLLRRIERCSYADAARILQRMIATTKAVFASEQATSRHGVITTASFRPFRRRIPLNPYVPFLQEKKGITVQTATRFEAGLPDSRSRFLQTTVAVRLHDMQGSPIGYCGRRLHAEDITLWGKWRFPNQFPRGQLLYNAYRALPARRSGIVLVECLWAAMRLAQAGIAGVVALLGTTFTATQLDWLAKAPTVLLLLDGDQAGYSCARSMAQALDQRTSVRIHDLALHQEPEDLTDEKLAVLVEANLPFSLNPPPSVPKSTKAP